MSSSSRGGRHGSAGNSGGSSHAPHPAHSHHSNHHHHGSNNDASVIRFRCGLSNTILDVLLARGWKRSESETDFDFLWGSIAFMRDRFDNFYLSPNQRVNHFRNQYELTRKDLLVKNLKRARRALEKEDLFEEATKYDFFPTTFDLPSDYGMFVEHFKRDPDSVWIMKPVGSAQGKGIFLFKKLEDISDWQRNNKYKPDAPQAQAYIVQRYIPNPYLIGGKKFDLRLYALVTSYSPLTVWIYRDGFARFSAKRFSMDAASIDNLYMHLTNVAIQKTAPDYNRESGIKWGLRSLRLHLASQFGEQACNNLFREMQMVILRSLLAVQKVMIQDKKCFELYGYDLLIDDNLKPWLIEVNASPSLSADTPADYEMKFGLLSDMLDVLDLEGNFEPGQRQIGGFDLAYAGGFVPSSPPGTYASFLGCHNDRVANLKNLHKEAKRARKKAAAETAGGGAAATSSSGRASSSSNPSSRSGVHASHSSGTASGSSSFAGSSNATSGSARGSSRSRR